MNRKCERGKMLKWERQLGIESYIPWELQHDKDLNT